MDAQSLEVACVVLSGLVSDECDDFEEGEAGLPGDMPTNMTHEEMHGQTQAEYPEDIWGGTHSPLLEGHVFVSDTGLCF